MGSLLEKEQATERRFLGREFHVAEISRKGAATEVSHILQEWQMVGNIRVHG